MNRTTLPAALAAITLAGAAAAQDHGPVAHGDALTQFWTRANFDRVDVVGIGDSNGLYAGAGWDEGWTRALESAFGLYATGLHALGEGQGAGAAAGYRCHSVVPTSPFQFTGAPAASGDLLAPGSLPPLSYLYLPEGQSTSAAAGLRLEADSALGITGPLRFHVVHGIFPGAGPGSMRPVVGIDSPLYQLVASGNPVSTRGAASGASDAWVDVPAGARTGPLTMLLAGPEGTVDAEPVVGPAIGYYARAERTDRPRGAAFHTLLAMNGASTRDLAAALIGASDGALSLYFSRVRALQGASKFVLVRINSGLWDRTETEPSINGVTPGNSDLAFGDNIEAIIERLHDVWMLNSWPESELHFLLTASHPVTYPDDTLLRQYRLMANMVCHHHERTAAVRWDLLLTADDMSLQGLYADGTHEHLTAEGYRALASIELANLVRDGACTADFDGDGDVGTDADIEAFFAALGGNAPGNVDLDGDGDVGTDADIEAFFSVLSGGPC